MKKKRECIHTHAYLNNKRDNLIIRKYHTHKGHPFKQLQKEESAKKKEEEEEKKKKNEHKKSIIFYKSCILTAFPETSRMLVCLKKKRREFQ